MSPENPQDGEKPLNLDGALAGLPRLSYTRKPAPNARAMRDPNMAYGIETLDQLTKVFDEKRGAASQARKKSGAPKPGE